MEIDSVKLHILKEVKPGTKVDGLFVEARPEIKYFEVDVRGEDANVTVPNDPKNSQYQLIATWYDEQEEKPFEFDFER